ncbi:hypothetical protein [Flavobacterium pectinovorum]|uniref:Uncharacterized protein n=1 Tax=Flavobacterium pectinovorum TaxID=29533 RepID=A0A502EA70_9FLAO|nr:hypothetical protein [Flavobacterium pectinovorum]TPG33321.1 hypothetical protein EAH81_24670 [Flavobacterium pectinovorum]
MKKIFLLIVLLCGAVSYSQDVLEVIAKETCQCLEIKKAKEPNLSSADFKTEVGVCIIKSYTDHKSEFKPAEKVDFTDKDGMGKLGEKVAIKMLQICPDMIMELGRSAINEDKEEVQKEDPSLSGEVIDIKWEQFVTLQLKDKTGRNYNFLLLDSFDTASLLTNNEIKKKDNLKVSYTEIELFDSKAKEFRYFKILTKIEKQ